ncbi:hypothetical protein TeGR_g15210, partial [Tetraparma gracilis]
MAPLPAFILVLLLSTLPSTSGLQLPKLSAPDLSRLSAPDLSQLDLSQLTLPDLSQLSAPSLSLQALPSQAQLKQLLSSLPSFSPPDGGWPQLSSLQQQLQLSLPPLPADPSWWPFLQASALGGHHVPFLPLAALAAALPPLLLLSSPLAYPAGNPYPPASPSEPTRYSPSLARAYYRNKPGLVLRRMLQLAFSGLPLGLSLLLDRRVFRRADDPSTQAVRAKQLLAFVERSGCTYIKIGQAASVRSDIINPLYAAELAKLQDRVPPFPATAARALLERALGRPLGEVFEDAAVFDRAPVASASIGQVYKATPRGGEPAAVKVQRPNVLNEIALDLFIVREFAPLYAKITRATTDLQGLADEWGRGFIQELDYVQ